MPLLTASMLGKFYGADEIFGALTFAIQPGARIALVGANGTGKSSLLKLLAGLDLPSSGELQLAGACRIGYLPQLPELAGTHSLWQEQLKAFAALRAMEAQLARLEQDMANAARHEAALAEYGPLQAEFERQGGYQYEARIKAELSGLGFYSTDYNTSLAELSGGQKTRALLARLLLEAPDLLLLDEPSNHLDVQAIEWLERKLATYPGAVLAVSHDRAFIDHFAQQVWELESRHLQCYHGNYSAYLQQREQARASQEQQFQAQQAFIRKEQAFIRQHMGSRRTAQAKGRQKKLDTLEKRGAILEDAPRQRKKMRIDMGDLPRSGDHVLRTQALQIGYEGAAPLLTMPDCLVLRGETVAILGANGSGKTTLLRTISGQLPALAGTVRLGAQVKVGTFAQAQENLRPELSLIDTVCAIKPMPQSQARSWLGRFLFSGEDVFRRIESLSGGERGRVALASLALQGANLLLLDEPSNHLDIDSQEVLQAALRAFDGTILLVSHDRYLIGALATQVWELRDGAVQQVRGGYREFLRQRKAAAAREKSATKPARLAQQQPRALQNGMSPFHRERRCRELEEHIEQLEQQLQALKHELDVASSAGNAASVRTLGTTYTDIDAALEAALEEWGELAS